MIWSGESLCVATIHDFVSWSRTTTATTMSGAMRRAPDRVASAAPFDTLLAVDAGLGPRDGLEPRHRDPPTRGRAEPVRAVLHALERGVDLLDRLPCGGRQHEVALALDADRVALARLLVELRVALLALGDQRLGLRLELGRLADVAVALLEQELLQLLERLRRDVGRLLRHEHARQRAGLARGLLLHRLRLRLGDLLRGRRLLGRGLR